MVQSFNVAATIPADVALSPDGSKLYSAGEDGFVRIYDVRTGALLGGWDVGTKLGGMDISPDGSFLMVVERQPLSTTGSQWDRLTSVTIYKVDTTTGAVTSYPFQATGYDYTFFDVAILANGTALISQDFSGSGWVRLKLLDLATGQYSTGPETRQSAILTRSPTGDAVLIGEPNISSGEIDLYRTGTGIVAKGYGAGFNTGIQAFSAAGNFVANYIYSEGIKIYDGSLRSVITLNAAPAGASWSSGRASGLVFDATGQNLFVLDNVANTIVQIRTSDWLEVNSIPVGADVGGWSGGMFGNRLILDPLSRYFSVVTDTGLVLVANPNAPAMQGTAGSDTLYGTLFDDSINGNDGDDALFGGRGVDTLAGGAGNDQYYVYAADSATFQDVIVELPGGGDSDQIRTTFPTFSLAAFPEIESLFGIANIDFVLTGNDRDNYIIGMGGNDTLVGGLGNDKLEGNGGNDTMRGGLGDDEYVVHEIGDVVEENSGEGTDTVWTSLAYYTLLGTNIENLYAASQVDHEFRGNASNNHISGAGGQDMLFGYQGNDYLSGGQNNDFMVGGTGDDEYVVDHLGDIVVEHSGEGTDTIWANLASYSLAGTHVENLSAGSNVDHNFRGSGANNVIVGGHGQDSLFGDGGNDVLQGGKGNDLLRGGAGVDSFDGGEGTDTVDYSDEAGPVAVNLTSDMFVFPAGHPHASRSLGSGEVLDGSGNYETVAGIENFILTGGNDRLVGSEDGNRVDAGAGNDNIDGAGGNDLLFGRAGDDRLGGGGGDDILDGGVGADRTEGGLGNDTHHVDNAGDVVVEFANAGADTVATSISYALTANVENLQAANIGGSDPLSLTGNGLANFIWGTQGNNAIDGGGGADFMIGYAGDDVYHVDHVSDIAYELEGGGADTVATVISYTLAANIENLQSANIGGTAALALTGNAMNNFIWGTQGNNILDGGGGADFLIGYAGDDIYHVDNVSDIAYELAGGGSDTAVASINYTLAANVENLQALNIAGSDPLALTGNGTNNFIWATQGNNVIDGGGGADVMIGFAGNDFYFVDDTGDIAYEEAGGGIDTVAVSADFTLRTSENYRLAANVENLQAANIAGTETLWLTGNELNNFIWGNQGGNSLGGGAGIDRLYGYGGVDLFFFDTAPGDTNFDYLGDFQAGTDKISLDDAVFSALTVTTLAPGAFVNGTAALDADDRIIYDSATGNIFYDADGNGAGAAVLFAVIPVGQPLTASDFIVY